MPVNSKRTAMKKSRKKNSSPKPRRSRNKGQDYTTLEDRKMLAVTTGFTPGTGGAGVLTINLSAANEAASVNVVGSNILVNGSQVAGGTAASNVDQIVISGNTAANQDVSFIGDFSNTGLVSVSAANIDDFAINGNMTLSGNLTVNGGTVSDADNVGLIVGGVGSFTAASVTLGGATNETRFQQTAFNVSGAVDLQEDDNTVLGSVNAATLRLESNGRILDGFTTQINVSGLAQLFGNAGVRLGDNGADIFNAGTVHFRSSGQVSINEDSSTNIVNSNTARSMNLRSLAAITDADTATLNVQFQSGFEATSVRIGDTATDEFNSNSIYFFTTGRFDLTEDSDTLIIEEKNFAQSMRLTSTGQIADEENAQTTVTNLAEFDAQSAIIGDRPSDFFTAGSIQFNTVDQFRLTENNDTNILGVNRAENSIITSVGDLSNSSNADIVVNTNASFRGNSINIGNQSGDNAQFGSLTFITPNVPIANAPAGFASVNISEDDSTQFGGNSTAGTAAQTGIPAIPGNVRITSTEGIIDGSNSSVNVTGNMSLTTGNNGNITVGDSGTDAAGNAFDATFNTGSLTINTDGTGNAQIYEDSAIFLVGNSQVNSLRLEADGGQASITDSATADINVNFNLNVRASFVNLGSAVDTNGANTDMLNFNTVTFNTSGNTLLSVDKGFFLVGSSTANNLTLTSTGDIRDSSPTGGTPASTTVQTSANFTTPLDAVIGESGADFFTIVSGNIPGVGNVGGNANVVVS